MGIPALFRWLSTKYPKVTSPVVEEVPKQVDELTIPIDTTLPNPNQVEFDNLYLDMNGIIHPCCHPEDKPAPQTEDEMFLEIFGYIDRIFGMIRPRKLLYMAIDGVAPRAKMNQQRSRRFRAAREETLKKEEQEKLKKEWEANGQEWPETMNKTHFDSNCITPGTPFMSRLADCLRYYISHRLNTDPAWKNISVILSDASVPGEGEHKIMDYIRKQRNLPDYNPNTHHVLYGLDADLIMLALSTHEPHFKILREDVFYQAGKDKICSICGQSGHIASVCRGEKKEKVGEYDEKTVQNTLKPFVFLHVSILREYLEVELKVSDLPFRWSLERALDDWVFMCFFVGNDFLPHLPSLEIREGAIDTLIKLWKTNLKEWGGFLTDSGDINLSRVQEMMICLGDLEDDVFKNRREIEERKRAARIRRKKEARLREARGASYPTLTSQNESYHQRESKESVPEIVANASQAQLAHAYARPQGGSTEANKSAAAALKASLLGSVSVKRKLNDLTSDVIQETKLEKETVKQVVKEQTQVVVRKEQEEEEVLEEGLVPPILDLQEEEAPNQVDVPIAQEIPQEEDEESEPEDNIRLWESGWKERYYEKKFHVDLDNLGFKKGVVESYVQGLCWVLKYYYQGVQSWKWFYPYHYSPFSSDFSNISNYKIQFELGTPFRPIEQLMGVLPAASKQHIPIPFHDLMENDSSPIIDFYPVDFPIDLNGKKYAWQGVALLPFIEEDRLLKAITPVYSQLSQEETIRNSTSYEVIYVSSLVKVFEPFCCIYGKRVNEDPLELTRGIGATIFGSALPDENVSFPGTTIPSPLPAWNQPDIHNNQSISVQYLMPKYKSGYIFRAQLLYGVTLEKPVLEEYDKYLLRNPGVGRGRRNDNNRDSVARFMKHGASLNSAVYGYDSRQSSRDKEEDYPPTKRRSFESNRHDSYSSKREDSYYNNNRYDGQYESNDRYRSGQSRSGGYRPSMNYQNYSSSSSVSSYQRHAQGYSHNHTHGHAQGYAQGTTQGEGERGNNSFLNSLISSSSLSVQEQQQQQQNVEESSGPMNYLSHLPGGARYSQPFNSSNQGYSNQEYSTSQGYTNQGRNQRYTTSGQGYSNQQQYRYNSSQNYQSQQLPQRPPVNLAWNRNLQQQQQYKRE